MVRPITITAVERSFAVEGEAPVRALAPVHLTVAGGEFLSLVGPSGCGKTTLLRIIAGLLPATAGEVRIGDDVVRAPDPRVGIVFQKPTLLPWRSVMENCLLPVEIMRPFSPAEGRERAEALLHLTGLWDFRDRLPRELSGGMQQRAAIARALVPDPEILLMDEPFSALDEFTRERLNEELLRLCAERPKTVIFVTHNIGEAVFLSDRIGVMAPRPGRLGAVIDLATLPRQRDAGLRKHPAYFDKMAETRAAFDELLA